MIHIAICDVAENETTELKKRVHNICESISKQVHISVFNTTFSLLTYVVDEVKGQVDIIFMEVCHKRIDGVTAAEAIQNLYPHIKIIFMSDKLEHSKEIFRIDPVYFLVKPVEENYLYKALNKSIRQITENNMDIIRIGNGVGKNRIITIKMSDIYYIKSDRRKITFYLADRQYSCYMKLDEVSNVLNKDFLRVHQSYAVNLSKIRSVENGNILLGEDIVVPISSSRLKSVVESIKEYMGV